MITLATTNERTNSLYTRYLSLPSQITVPERERPDPQVTEIGTSGIGPINTHRDGSILSDVAVLPCTRWGFLDVDAWDNDCSGVDWAGTSESRIDSGCESFLVDVQSSFAPRTGRPRFLGARLVAGL